MKRGDGAALILRKAFNRDDRKEGSQRAQRKSSPQGTRRAQRNGVRRLNYRIVGEALQRPFACRPLTHVAQDEHMIGASEAGGPPAIPANARVGLVFHDSRGSLYDDVLFSVFARDISKRHFLFYRSDFPERTFAVGGSER